MINLYKDIWKICASSVLQATARCIFLRFQGHLTWLRASRGSS